MAKIAFLVFDRKEKRSLRKNQSFDWSGNIGAYMLLDALRRQGIKVGFCSVATAKNFDLVLVSLTSPFDVINFIRAVGRNWKNRKFKVLVGGFGCQNIYPLREYADFAFFGRAENDIKAIIQLVLGGDDSHESLMNLSHIKKVKMCQANCLYPHTLDVKPRPFKEINRGCEKKCYFCFYSFSRKWIPETKEFKGALAWGGYQQRTFCDVIRHADTHLGQLSTAIDGFSERLRFAVNKRISNQKIQETIEWISHNWGHPAMALHVYCIGSYPGETEDDRNELRQVLARCNLGKTKIFMRLKIFPLIPTPLTPSAFLPVNLDVDWRRYQGKIYYETNGLSAKFSVALGSKYLQLIEMILVRATEQTQPLIETLCFSRKLKKLNSYGKLRALQTSFDLEPYLREYSIDEQLPTWYLTSHIPQTSIKKMAKELKVNLGLIK